MSFLFFSLEATVHVVTGSLHTSAVFIGLATPLPSVITSKAVKGVEVVQMASKSQKV